MSIAALGDEKRKLLYFCSESLLFGIPREHWDVLYIVRKVFLKGIQRRRDRSKRFSSYGGNSGTSFTDLDPERDLPLFPCLGILAVLLATYDYLRRCYGFSRKGDGLFHSDHYGNYRISRVNLRLHLVLPISPLPLIGFWTYLVLTESYSPGESNAVGFKKFGAELAGRRIIPELLHPDILTDIGTFLMGNSRSNRSTLNVGSLPLVPRRFQKYLGWFWGRKASLIRGESRGVCLVSWF